MSGKTSRPSKGIPNGVVLLLAVIVLGGTGWGIVASINSRNEEEQPRHDFVAQRVEEVRQLTHGGIVVTGQSYFIDGLQNVELTIGNCPSVSGYFETPERPTRLEEVSTLYLRAPIGANPRRNGKTEKLPVKVNDKNFTTILESTLLKACITGDSRFAPPGQQ